MDPDQDPVEFSVLAERLVLAIAVVLAVAAVVLAAALAFDWTPVFAPVHELVPDPAADLPF